jgi:hypothetical protein
MDGGGLLAYWGLGLLVKIVDKKILELLLFEVALIISLQKVSLT